MRACWLHCWAPSTGLHCLDWLPAIKGETVIQNTQNLNKEDSSCEFVNTEKQEEGKKVACVKTLPSLGALLQFPPREVQGPVINTCPSTHMIVSLKLKCVSLSVYRLVNSIAIAFKQPTTGHSTELIIPLLLGHRLDFFFLLNYSAMNTIVYQAFSVLKIVSFQ